MSEGPNQGRSPVKPANDAVGSPGGPGAPGTVEAFASQVLSLVAANTQALRGALRVDLLEDLIASVMSPDQNTRKRMLTRFRDAGISNASIVDRYLPEAARKLGIAWCEDSMGFADVTIGTARLQSLLRDLRAPQVTKSEALNALVVVPEDAYHTLGAGVVADQLRRLNVSVHMSLGLPLMVLAELVETHDFNVVLVSASASERLETLRELVNCVRNAMREEVPIVLGGTITNEETDIRTLTGADYVSNNPEEALRACGLMIPKHAVEPPGHRG